MGTRLYVLVAGAMLWSGVAFAQTPWPAPPPQPVLQRWPDDPPAPQARPAQPVQPAAPKASRAKAAKPTKAAKTEPAEGTQPIMVEESPATTAAAPKKQAAPAQAARAIACSGAFAKDSNHLKLATLYGAQNVTFTDIDGPEGSKLKASVIFPKDPKRRLEVLWQNEAARTDTALVAINGQSTWTAPKGLRLGIALTALEKLNGKPFKLSGFDQDNVAAVANWQAGALDSLPGGCKVGIRLALDAKAPDTARGPVSGASKEFMSSDPVVRSVSPKVAEILIGY